MRIRRPLFFSSIRRTIRVLFVLPIAHRDIYTKITQRLASRLGDWRWVRSNLESWKSKSLGPTRIVYSRLANEYDLCSETRREFGIMKMTGATRSSRLRSTLIRIEPG